MWSLWAGLKQKRGTRRRRCPSFLIFSCELLYLPTDSFTISDRQNQEISANLMQFRNVVLRILNLKHCESVGRAACYSSSRPGSGSSVFFKSEICHVLSGLILSRGHRSSRRGENGEEETLHSRYCITLNGQEGRKSLFTLSRRDYI